ncbi:MAG: CpsD/CapB family tyrosine-protein kinase [Pseudomonadota bacterium]
MAEEVYQENLLRNTRAVPTQVVPPPTRQISNDGYMEQYYDLKTSILSRHPNGALKSILFNSTYSGDGTTTTATNFSTVLAKDSKFKVLLMEVNLRTPSLQEMFKIDDAISLDDVLSGSYKLAPPIHKVGPGELYITAFSGKLFAGPVSFFESDEFDEFFKEMCERFDYVILDSPPALIFSEFRVLCSKVDGVVLVLKAGKTRRQVALRAKKELEEAGAKLLGVVVNRRKYYIPNWVYKLL